MPTIKQRINIVADKDIETAIKTAAKRDSVSIASKAVELLRLGLEIEEDYAFANIAHRRDVSHGKLISHDRVWKKVLGK